MTKTSRVQAGRDRFASQHPLAGNPEESARADRERIRQERADLKRGTLTAGRDRFAARHGKTSDE
ncbi:hypothetical protein SB659_07695 [Arthrobacter sp. SIMBA_036]|uniref:hypothetical protein n=1 Tax=Arthrobacter sp. SIMBA_036 TaxID=3085778 RepID=UPI00397E78AA